MDKDILSLTLEAFNIDATPANEVSPLILAYLGDAVYELVIRSMDSLTTNKHINAIHRETVHLVNAGTQAKMVDIIMPLLSDEEQSVYRRGKNAKSATSAKNASLYEYHKATGFEALMGYLYLTDNTKRAIELVKAGLEAMSETEDGRK